MKSKRSHAKAQRHKEDYETPKQYSELNISHNRDVFFISFAAFAGLVSLRDLLQLCDLRVRI